MADYTNFKINDAVMVELIDRDRFTGTIRAIGKNFSYIVLENVHHITENKDIPGQQRYYPSEIESIKKLSANNGFNDEPPTVLNQTSTTNGSASPQHRDDPPINGMKQLDHSHSSSSLEEEYTFFKELLSRITFINQCDSTYYKALKDIKAEEMVGLSMEGVSCGRLRTASLITFATPHNIYIFDLMFLGQLFPEMKAILENSKPRKILFDSRFICDNLHHEFKCNLNGIMDLLVCLSFLSRISISDEDIRF